MDITGNPDIQQTKDMLRTKLAAASKSGEFVERYHDARDAVSYWDFATDEMFSVVPFHHELNKFKKGRKLKLAGLDDAFARSAYAFGYSAQDRLLLTVHSYEPGAANGVECMSHAYSTSESGQVRIDYERSIQYPVSENKPRLVAVGMLTWLRDDAQMDIGVGSDDAYSVAVYSHVAGRVEKVDRFAHGWNGQTRYDFEYDTAGNLHRIVVGTRSWWKAKK